MFHPRGVHHGRFRAFLAVARRFRSALYGSIAACVLFALAAIPAVGQGPRHPLDGLTAPEYWAVLDALKASGHPDAKTRYPLVSLHEPPKEEVPA